MMSRLRYCRHFDGPVPMLHILLPQHLMVISLEFVFCSKRRKCAGSLFADMHYAELEFVSIP